VVVVTFACSNERRAQHEALAKSLERPVSLLCATSHPEAGGCDADCAARVAAGEGKAARDAAEGLASIPPVSDPATEGLLADVRKSARAVQRAFGGACKEAPPADGAATDAVKACAEMRAQVGWNVNDLRAALTRFGSNAELHSGVAMPVPTPEGCAKLAR
jgi:hypothetical protein